MDLKKEIRFKNYSLLFVILFIVSFLAAQRFLLSPFDTFICLVPFVLSFFYINNTILRNSLLIFSLFVSVDNAAEDLAISNSLIRYAIYLYSIYILYRSSHFDPKKILAFVVLLTFYLILTVFNILSIDLETLFRDILILLLSFPILCSYSNENHFAIDFELLGMLLAVYLLSEILNLFLRPLLGFNSADYLSYSSTKSFIVFPSIYYLYKRNFKIAIPILLATLAVLIAYTTRMIILTYTATLVLILATIIRLNLKYILLYFSIFIFFVLFFKLSNIEFEGFKATGVFIQFFAEGSLFEKFLIIDPVRYYETKLFFDRNAFSVLFGDGFGSGLIDLKNELFFVSPTDSAFSPKELMQRKYYNLHDTWIDLGLRFGFLSILVLYALIFKFLFFRKNINVQILSAVLIVLFSCATYSTQGLILVAFVFYASKFELNKV